MIRLGFYISSILSLLLIISFSFVWPPVWYFLILVLPLIILGISDINSHHNILRNYPVIGHLRYMFEFIRPEIQQYFVATNLSGRPYNREQRSLVYRRAKNLDDTHPFGTEHDIIAPGYEFALHSINVKKITEDKAYVQIGGAACTQPYRASLANISAMSYGALSPTAVQALNRGAKEGGFYQNTGEGGLTPHHLAENGDLVWQIGTGYFGCRTADGHFDPEKFTKKANLDQVKMIEIKISQGAKPSHGGILPAQKVTPEIAEIRGIPPWQECISPPDQSTFSNPLGLCKFIQDLRQMSHGKPVGFKLCVGIKKEFMGICKAMLETGIYPDFITVDGAEGGTGAAPLIYTNRLGMPGDHAIAFVHNCLVGCNLRDKITLIASSKVVSGFDLAKKLALGANLVNIARPFLFSIGCIQALKCNTNLCPTGVTSSNPRRYKAIDVNEKAEHVKNYHQKTIESLLDLTGALGVADPQKLSPQLIYYRLNESESQSFSELFHFVEPGNFLGNDINPAYREPWQQSRSDAF